MKLYFAYIPLAVIFTSWLGPVRAQGVDLVDASIKRVSDGDSQFIGKDIVNTGGENQARGGSAARGESIEYIWRVENKSTAPDAVVLRGAKGENGWTVNYFAGTNDITAPIASMDGWKSPTIAGGDVLQIRVRVAAAATLLPTDDWRGSILSILLLAASDRDDTFADGVRIVTIVPRPSAANSPTQPTVPGPTGDPNSTVKWNWSWKTENYINTGGGQSDPARGSNGANRVVGIAKRHAISGLFTEPDINGMTDTKYYAVRPGPSAEAFVATANKPTFYFGIETEAHNSTTLKTDAGFQWEPTAIRYRDGQPENVDAAWTVFFRVTIGRSSEEGSVNGNTWKGGSWGIWRAVQELEQLPGGGTRWITKRVPKGQLGQVNLAHGLQADGKLYLSSDIGNIDPFVAWPSTYGGLPPLSKVSIRRVVGVTQGRGRILAGSSTTQSSWVWYDGSVVENLAFDQGKVSPIAQDGLVHTTSATEDWPTALQDNSYDDHHPDSNGNYNRLQPDSKNVDGSYVIDFKVQQPNGSYTYQRESHGGTYTTNTRKENVRIKFGDEAPSPESKVSSRPSYIAR